MAKSNRVQWLPFELKFQPVKVKFREAATDPSCPVPRAAARHGFLPSRLVFRVKPGKIVPKLESLITKYSWLRAEGEELLGMLRAAMRDVQWSVRRSKPSIPIPICQERFDSRITNIPIPFIKVFRADRSMCPIPNPNRSTHPCSKVLSLMDSREAVEDRSTAPLVNHGTSSVFPLYRKNFEGLQEKKARANRYRAARVRMILRVAEEVERDGRAAVRASGINWQRRTMFTEREAEVRLLSVQKLVCPVPLKN
jgi:hypothetical protein